MLECSLERDDAVFMPFMSPVESRQTTISDPIAAMRTRLATYSYNQLENPNIKSEECQEAVADSKAPARATEKKSVKKRSASTLDGSTTVASVKKVKSTTKQRSAGDPYNPENNLVDSLRPNLTLVFIGLNPGLTTALTGHAYAHPSNFYWKLLHLSGITPVRHAPSETRDLMDLYAIGNTNICKRPTRSGDGLSKEEMIEGAGILEEKIRDMKPEAVCIVGKGIWDTIYKVKVGKNLKANIFKYGWQDEELWLGRTLDEDGSVVWAGSRTYVTTTTSGLAASMTPAQKLEVWKPLGDWIQEKRGLKTEDEAKVKAED